MATFLLLHRRKAPTEWTTIEKLSAGRDDEYSQGSSDRGKEVTGCL